MTTILSLFISAVMASCLLAQAVTNSSPMLEKAKYLQRNLIDKHLEDGLYVSMVPAAPEGTKLTHTVDDPGNVIHAGVWTGRYLAGVAYQYAVTKDPAVRKHGGDLLVGLRRLQEVTGKPGLLARGYVKGHGPVEGFERGGGDSAHWHQGQGAFADYRFYSDVSVDNFNAVLYGYALYFDLAADAEQKKMIAYDVDRLMTHLLDNHYRIIDLNGKVTQYGHVGVDPDPSRDSYYAGGGDSELRRYITGPEWHPGLRASLMALADLLIAYHVTGKARYMDEYRKVIARFAGNAEPAPADARPYSLERIARVNHSSEGQAYEALFNLIRYEDDPKLLAIYDKWVSDLWDLNWMEGNSLYTFMTVALIPQKWEPVRAGLANDGWKKLPHAEESMQLSIETLKRYPIDRVLRPVMNSIRADIEMSPFPDRGNGKQAAKPVPIDQRPLDNEYAWKGNPYAVDGWLKPTVTSLQFACDDPMVAWFSDAAGRAYMSRDGMKSWTDVSYGLEGAKVKRLAASKERTFVVYADTDRGVVMTRDGGMSWRAFDANVAITGGAQDQDKKPVEVKPEFAMNDPHKWAHAGEVDLRLNESGKVVRRGGRGTEVAWMQGWKIPVATWMIETPRGIFAGGPGGAYSTSDGAGWKEVKLWREEETGAADYLHAYWMGRYYGFYRQ